VPCFSSRQAWDVARQGEHHGQRVFRGGRGGPAGRVHHQDAPLRRGGDVDVVDSDAGPPDHPKPLRAVDQLPVDPGRAPNDDTVHLADDPEQPLPLQLRLHAYVDDPGFAKNLDTGGIDPVEEKDAEFGPGLRHGRQRSGSIGWL
jgi:hypothetical protein